MSLPFEILQIGSNYTAATSVVVTMPSRTRDGSFLIIAVVNDIASTTVSSITNNGKANTFTQFPGVRAVDSSISMTDIWYSPDVYGGSSTVTVNVAAGAGTGAVVYECRGIVPLLGASRDRGGLVSSGASSTTPTGASLSTINPVTLGIASCKSSGTISAGRLGWSVGAVINGNAAGHKFFGNHVVNSQASFTSTSGTFCMSTAYFQVQGISRVRSR